MACGALRVGHSGPPHTHGMMGEAAHGQRAPPATVCPRHMGVDTDSSLSVRVPVRLRVWPTSRTRPATYRVVMRASVRPMSVDETELGRIYASTSRARGPGCGRIAPHLVADRPVDGDENILQDRGVDRAREVTLGVLTALAHGCSP